jgi:hypothetical protein
MEDIYRQLSDNKHEHELLMSKIDLFGEKLEEVRLNIAEMPDKIFERADKKYASKLSERVVYGLVGVICTGVLVAILELVIRK